MATVLSWLLGSDPNNGPRGESDNTDGFVDALETVQEPTSVQQPTVVQEPAGVQQPTVAHTLPMLGKPLVAQSTAGSTKQTAPTASIVSERPVLQTAPAAPAPNAAESAADSTESHPASNVHHTRRFSFNPHNLPFSLDAPLKYNKAQGDGDLERGDAGTKEIKPEYMAAMLERNKDLAKGDTGAFDLLGSLDLAQNVLTDLEHRYNLSLIHI